MKVLVIGSRIPYPLHDGGAIATYNLLKGLSTAGAEITFISLNTNKHYVDPDTIQREFSFLKTVETQDINTDVKPLSAFLNLFSSKSYNIERFHDLSFETQLMRLIQEEHFDIIHFEGLFVAKYVNAVKRSCKIPVLLRQHNIEYNIWKTLASQTHSFLKRQYIKLLAKRMERFEKQVIQNFDSVVAITGADEQAIRELGYKGLLSHIPAGIAETDAPAQNPNYRTLYHIGSMEWMPNQQAMEWFHHEIWPLIKSQAPGAEFYMAGKNMPEKYRSLEGTGFHVEGEVQNLHDFTHDKSILVVPLKSGSGIRIKTIEAMLSGKAVVSTSQGALGLPLVHNEHCLLADSPEDFAHAVVRLINDHGLRNKLAENGRKFASENFGNDSVSRKWMEFYGKLMKTSR